VCKLKLDTISYLKWRQPRAQGGLGIALVVIIDSPNFWDKGRSCAVFDHCRRIEDDYQSGSKPPHSKGFADLCIGFIYMQINQEK